MKIDIDISWFRFVAELPAEECQRVCREVWNYAKNNSQYESDSAVWEVMKDIIDQEKASNRRRAAQNRINGAKHVKHDRPEVPNDEPEPTVSKMEIIENSARAPEPVTPKPEPAPVPVTDSQTASVEHPFITLTNDIEILAALSDVNSRLSVFLATGQGYDLLNRIEQEFVDRPDVRSKCKWQREQTATAKTVRKWSKPTLAEWLEYCRGQNLDEKIMKNAYESYVVADWHDSLGKPIFNWKQKILQVWKLKGASHQSSNFLPKSKAEINTEKSYAAYAEFLKMTGG